MPTIPRLVPTMALAVLVLVTSGTGAFAAELTGRIVGVRDGDTVDLLTPADVSVRVRLAGIDAPEMGQAFGRAAKQALSSLVYRRDARVVWSKRDSYGRVVGKVLVEDADVNLQLIERGLAWHYTMYAAEQSAADRSRYAAAEAAARARRIGLWGDGKAVPPWVFRIRTRGPRPPGRPPGIRRRRAGNRSSRATRSRKACRTSSFARLRTVRLLPACC